MTLEDAKRQIVLRLDALSPEQYEAVKKCITKGGGIQLSDVRDEKYQLRMELDDALELLWENCQKDGADFEKMVRAWQGGDWETTIVCLLLQGNLTRIQQIANSI